VRWGSIHDALFAVGAACTPGYLDEFADLVAEVVPESARPPGRAYLTNDVVPLFFAAGANCDRLVIIAQ
jgi:hypothetical protein